MARQNWVCAILLAPPPPPKKKQQQQTTKQQQQQQTTTNFSTAKCHYRNLLLLFEKSLIIFFILFREVAFQTSSLTCFRLLWMMAVRTLFDKQVMNVNSLAYITDGILLCQCLCGEFITSLKHEVMKLSSYRFGHTVGQKNYIVITYQAQKYKIYYMSQH